jgi:hypothetical protein
MMYGSYLVKACSLPCCKTNMPMPKCPFLRATAPRDLIASSVPTFEDTLQPLHSVGFTSFLAPRRIAIRVANFVESIRLLLLASAPPVRAPPSDVYLIAA